MTRELTGVVQRGDKRGQWLKGILDLCVLGILVDGEAYGYEITAQLAERGIGEVKGGTLYPALTKLENDGLATGSWRAGDGGPNRKYYRITEAGLAYLAQESAGWQALAASAADLMGLPDRARH